MFAINNIFFATAAIIFSLIGFFPYVQSILKGQTKPSSASWWTWAFISFITFSSAYFAGASWQVLLLPGWLCFVQLLIAILSIKYGDHHWDNLNKFCIGGALIGLALWLLTGQPLVALCIGIVADLLASIPNFRHVFKNPEQENLTGWTLGWASSLLEIFAMTTWSLAESGWAVYFFLNMSLTLWLVLRKRLARLV